MAAERDRAGEVNLLFWLVNRALRGIMQPWKNHSHSWRPPLAFMRSWPSRPPHRAKPPTRRRKCKRCRNSSNSRHNKRSRCSRSSRQRVPKSRRSRTILRFRQCRKWSNSGPSTTKARRSCRKFLAPRSTNSCRPSASRRSSKRLRKSAPGANPRPHRRARVANRIPAGLFFFDIGIETRTDCVCVMTCGPVALIGDRPCQLPWTWLTLSLACDAPWNPSEGVSGNKTKVQYADGAGMGTF